MEAYINYIIDVSCTIQAADGTILYGLLCESEDGVKDFEVYDKKKACDYREYYTWRSADYFNLLDRSAYGKPTDMTFTKGRRKVYTLFLEYTGRLYIAAYVKPSLESEATEPFKVVMVRCPDNVNLTYAAEVQREHSFRRFLEAREQRLLGKAERENRKWMI